MVFPKEIIWMVWRILTISLFQNIQPKEVHLYSFNTSREAMMNYLKALAARECQWILASASRSQCSLAFKKSVPLTLLKKISQVMKSFHNKKYLVELSNRIESNDDHWKDDLMATFNYILSALVTTFLINFYSITSLF